MKICTKCKEEKPRNDFYKRKDGVSAKCKLCTCNDLKQSRADSRIPEENEILAQTGLRRCSVCDEVKETTDFYTKRNSFEGFCKVCKNVKNLKRREADSTVDARNLAARHIHYEKNPEIKAARVQYERAYYQANKKEHHAWVAQWRKKNPEKSASYLKKWRLKNRDIMTYHANKRRTAKLNATPLWAEQEDFEIRLLYKQSKELSESSGVKHHVDHIVPLQSEFVCGLHCLANLQVITAFDNISKNNYHWPDMW